MVTDEIFPQLLDPLVLGENGQIEPLGSGDGDDFLQVAVDVLLILQSSETGGFNGDRERRKQSYPAFLSNTVMLSSSRFTMAGMKFFQRFLLMSSLLSRMSSLARWLRLP